MLAGIYVQVVVVVPYYVVRTESVQKEYLFYHDDSCFISLIDLTADKDASFWHRCPGGRQKANLIKAYFVYTLTWIEGMYYPGRL